ncbi:hypothetical protein C7974DRAFT_391037 [Boeremia exigua]|uniref:uncharacterized protein n=1 Tax=Boeremia exigua TaxID=749465 RepID=UPI001E8DC97E|nr:uncharacterized protein C7974DRAFT_391037 [Boeremia exigua]KAH6638192.1 hypothetical protein C7974DRAFT_391037 [Boeremia exigua]
MADDIEVLVHISASTTRQNDEQFRALADAYNNFKPRRIHRDKSARKRVKKSHVAGFRDQPPSTTAQRTPTSEAPEAPVPTGSKESYGSFPSDLSSGGHHQDHGSVPDDSMRPLSRLAQLDRSYLSWRARASPRTSSKHDQGEVQISSDGLEDADTGFIEDSQSALLAVQSQLPDTFSAISSDTSDDEYQDEPERPSRKYSPVGSPPCRIATEVTLPALLEDQVQAELGASPLKEIVDVSVSTGDASESCVDASLNQSDFSDLPIDAFPPPPAISVASHAALPSQITKHLAAIKAKNPSRFKPKRKRRTLETDERGYWRIDCTKWPPRIQQDFWSSLHEHVCSGRIGWGATLHRESSSIHTLGLVRLYCWGELIEHMWLLMWICSKGKVSDFGSNWIDADGVVVVEMSGDKKGI